VQESYVKVTLLPSRKHQSIPVSLSPEDITTVNNRLVFDLKGTVTSSLLVELCSKNLVLQDDVLGSRDLSLPLSGVALARPFVLDLKPSGVMKCKLYMHPSPNLLVQVTGAKRSFLLVEVLSCHSISDVATIGTQAS
jgi:hypothetical protein